MKQIQITLANFELNFSSLFKVDQLIYFSLPLISLKVCLYESFFCLTGSLRTTSKSRPDFKARWWSTKSLPQQVAVAG